MRWASQAGAAARWLGYYAVTGWNLFLVPLLQLKLGRAPWPVRWRSIRKWGRRGCRAFGIEVRLENPEGVPLDRPYLVVANHRSWFDQVALAGYYPAPFHCLVKQGYCDMPVLGYALVELGESIPVQDQTLAPDIRDRLAGYLERGDTVLLFPEGTRGHGRTLLPFRAGAFQYAARYGLPVLPIYIVGMEQILPKGAPLLSVRSGTARLIVGPPRSFSPEHWPEEMAAFEAAYREQHERYQSEADPPAGA